MANRLKGITLEIGGDTTKLSSSLSGVNSDIRNTKTALKDVERLLKLDPTNVDLLRQREKLLNDAVAETSEKLEKLKDAQQTMDANGVDKNTDQYMALQREIIETESDLKKLEDQASKSAVAVQKIAEAGDKLKSAGENVSSAGEKLLPVTAAVAGLGTAAVTTAANFESSMSQVQATMGITRDSMSLLNGESVNTMDALGDLANQMGSTTAFSASECADALNYLALAGYDTQQMADTLPIVLNLAAAGGIDLASASDMVTDAMSALGMETSEAGTMVDQMAKTASSTNTSVAQLGEGILTIGATAKSIKGGTAELNTALGILANNGIKGAEGGTHLRNIILSLQNPTDQAADAMDALGFSVYDSEGNMRSMNDILGDLNTAMDGMTSEEKANIISKIFNKTDLSSVNALLANTGDTWDELQGSIASSAGAAQQMADTQLDNLQGQLTILKSALEGLAISIGKLLMPFIKQIVGWIQSFVDWLNSLDEGRQKIIVTIALVAAAIGPVLIVIGKVMSAVGTIMTILPNLASAFGVVSKAVSALSGLISFIAANPIVLLIAAIVALVAAIAIKGDEIQAALQKVDDFLQGVFTKDWTEIFGPVIGGILNKFFGFFSGIWDSIKSVLDGVIDIIRGVFTGDWSRAWEGVKEVFSGIFSGLLTIAKEPLNAIIGFLNDIIDGVNWVISGLNKIPGVNLNTIGEIPMLAKGGTVYSGSAIVGEAGPEILTVSGGRAVVQPLNANTGRIEGQLGNIAGLLNQFAGTEQPIVVNLTLDGDVIGKTAINYSKRRSMAVGY